MIEHRYSKPLFIFESHRPREFVEAYIDQIARLNLKPICGEVGQGAWKGEYSTAYIVEADITPAEFLDQFGPLISTQEAVLYVASEHTKAGDRNALLFWRTEGATGYPVFSRTTSAGKWRKVDAATAHTSDGWTRRADGSYFIAEPVEYLEGREPSYIGQAA